MGQILRTKYPYLGDKQIKAIYLGGVKIPTGYLGDKIVWDEWYEYTDTPIYISMTFKFVNSSLSGSGNIDLGSGGTITPSTTNYAYGYHSYGLYLWLQYYDKDNKQIGFDEFLTDEFGSRSTPINSGYETFNFTTDFIYQNYDKINYIVWNIGSKYNDPNTGDKGYYNLIEFQQINGSTSYKTMYISQTGNNNIIIDKSNNTINKDTEDFNLDNGIHLYWQLTYKY